MQNVKRTYKLFLDDMRTPLEAYHYTGLKILAGDGWKIVRNYDQFISYIENNWEFHKAFPEIISFDHDLADEHYYPFSRWENYSEWERIQNFKEKNGFKCAEWLVNFCMDNNIKLCSYFVHSMNPVGRENITSLLDNFKKHQNG